MTEKINLLDYDRAGLESYFLKIGEKSFRAHQLLKWIYQHGVTDVGLMTNISNDLRVNLKESAHFRESCFHFLIRGSKVACELLCFSENRSSEPRKKSCQQKNVYFVCIPLETHGD